jgi:FtsZ-binding cell division protein ZapB
MIKYLKIGLIILISILITSIYVLYERNQSLKKELNIASVNQKAFVSENSSLKNENIAFKFTIEQLNYYNDSLLERMNSIREELKIKDNDLKQMQYLLSKASKKDTLILKDTLFLDPKLNIDTVLGDYWYNIELGLKYPSTITTTPTFISEKYIIVNTKKETVNPPKKCWLARLFQKKHRVVEVDVVEKNPYIENKQQRFIEIIE